MTDRAALRRHALTLALVVGVVAMGYVAVTADETGTEYAEFYVLNESGVAADYPTNLTVGEEGTVVFGVGNRRPSATTYTVLVTLDGRRVAGYSVSVPPDGTHERAVTFTAREPGNRTLVASLHRGERATGTPLQTLHLFVTVHGRERASSSPTPTTSG